MKMCVGVTDVKVIYDFVRFFKNSFLDQSIYVCLPRTLKFVLDKRAACV